MRKIIISVFLITIFISCKKEKKACWSVNDCMDNIITIKCDFTEEQIKAYINGHENNGCALTYHKK
ncbi:MAG: hypothetical protein V4556_08530 [Bacteroidota bacterium]